MKNGIKTTIGFRFPSLELIETKTLDHLLRVSLAPIAKVENFNYNQAYSHWDEQRKRRATITVVNTVNKEKKSN